MLAAVCGTTPVADGEQVRIPIGDATIIVGPLGGVDRPRVVGIEIEGVGIEPASLRLNGIDVTTRTVGPIDEAALPDETDRADAYLDHVALVVADLEDTANRWEAAIGVTPELIGLHPVSNGTLEAGRLAVGDRMVELLSPVPGTTSGAAARLERVGEGPMALALPAVDLDAKRRRLEQLGVKLLWQDPHWMVHPANPAGTLIQLTPRVKH